MRGIQFVTTVDMLSELGGSPASSTRRQLMARRGVAPQSILRVSGGCQGSITKSGNSYAIK